MIMPGRLYSLFIYQPWSDVNVKPIGMLHRQSSHLSRPSPTRSCTVADLQLQRPSSRKGHGWNFEGVDLLFVQIKNTTHFWNPFFFPFFFFRLFFWGEITPNFSEVGSFRQPLRLQDPLCSGVCSQRKVASKKSGRLPCSERWWPFSWCWAAQGFSDPKRGPRMDPSENLSGWNCDWRTQVAVTVPSWKVAIARLAADTSYCGKNWVTMINGIIGSL